MRVSPFGCSSRFGTTGAANGPLQQHGGDAVAHVVCTGDESAVSDVQRFDGVYAKLSARRLTSCSTHQSSTRAVASLCFDASVLRHTSAL